MQFYPRGPLEQAPQPFRQITPTPRTGWAGAAIGEWEMTADKPFGDCHPHEESNYVLEGTLIVECGGERVEVGPGDLITVPAGVPAYYSTPHYVRTLNVYGPNPSGAQSYVFHDPEVVRRPSTGNALPG